MLAFSTISHVGLILCGVGTLTVGALTGGALYVLGHACVKAGLFMTVGILLHDFGGVDEIKLRGKARRLRWLGIVFALGGLGLAGIPPYGTALGKALIDETMARGGSPWAPWVFVFTSALTGAAVLRAAGR